MMWILLVITHTAMNGDRHFETAYKTKDECYEALNVAAKYIPHENIVYVGCATEPTKARNTR